MARDLVLVLKCSITVRWKKSNSAIAIVPQNEKLFLLNQAIFFFRHDRQLAS